MGSPVIRLIISAALIMLNAAPVPYTQPSGQGPNASPQYKPRGEARIISGR